jgi:hypothetical protein
MIGNIKSILSALLALPALIALVPKIRELVIEVESPLVSGADKKAAVISMLNACAGAMTGAFGVVLPVTIVDEFAGIIIDLWVDFENLRGTFTHAPSAPVVTAAVAAQPSATAQAAEVAAPAKAESVAVVDPADANRPNELLDSAGVER